MQLKPTLLGLAVALLAPTAQADLLSENPGHFPSASDLTPPNVATVLYTQLDNASGNGAPIQNFEAALDAYDTEGADDFMVPAGGWTVEQFNFVVNYGLGDPDLVTETANLTVYADNAGLPGSAVCTYTELARTVSGSDMSVPLPTSCLLPEGTYWVALQLNRDFTGGGQVFWSNRTVASGSDAAWRNTGGGFGIGCTDWDYMSTCGAGGGEPDFLFSVSGTEGLPGIPLIGPVALLALGGGLGAVGARRLRRRS